MFTKMDTELDSDAKATCIWCQAKSDPRDLRKPPVCQHCYELLSRAGVPEYEIFDLVSSDVNENLQVRSMPDQVQVQ